MDDIILVGNSMSNIHHVTFFGLDF